MGDWQFEIDDEGRVVLIPDDATKQKLVKLDGDPETVTIPCQIIINRRNCGKVVE